jgi:hypothetical protein
MLKSHLPSLRQLQCDSFRVFRAFRGSARPSIEASALIRAALSQIHATGMQGKVELFVAKPGSCQHPS